MNTVDVEHLVENYLDQLRNALRAVPAERREQIINGIAEHIDEARTDEIIEGPEAVSALLARIGRPEDIAAALDEERDGDERRRPRRRRFWVGIVVLAIGIAGGAAALGLTLTETSPMPATSRTQLGTSTNARVVYAVPATSYSIVVFTDRPVWVVIHAPANSATFRFAATITPPNSPRTIEVTGTSSIVLGARAQAIEIKVGARVVGTISAPSTGVLYEFQPRGSRVLPPGDAQQSTPSPPRRVVPALLGEPTAQAEAQLRAAGLPFVVRSMPNGSQGHPGVVISQSPAAGSSVAAGAQVALTVGGPSATPSTATTVATT